MLKNSTPSRRNSVVQLPPVVEKKEVLGMKSVSDKLCVIDNEISDLKNRKVCSCDNIAIQAQIEKLSKELLSTSKDLAKLSKEVRSIIEN